MAYLRVVLSILNIEPLIMLALFLPQFLLMLFLIGEVMETNPLHGPWCI